MIQYNKNMIYKNKKHMSYLKNKQCQTIKTKVMIISQYNR